jgi:hypothetical protein
MKEVPGFRSLFNPGLAKHGLDVGVGETLWGEVVHVETMVVFVVKELVVGAREPGGASGRLDLVVRTNTHPLGPEAHKNIGLFFTPASLAQWPILRRTSQK